ncbi:uncharacterized protein V6R79_007956 [Siganus canaliculatus]
MLVVNTTCSSLKSHQAAPMNLLPHSVVFSNSNNYGNVFKLRGFYIVCKLRKTGQRRIRVSISWSNYANGAKGNMYILVEEQRQTVQKNVQIPLVTRHIMSVNNKSATSQRRTFE